jgi:hypothetical protein
MWLRPLCQTIAIPWMSHRTGIKELLTKSPTQKYTARRNAVICLGSLSLYSEYDSFIVRSTWLDALLEPCLDTGIDF